MSRFLANCGNNSGFEVYQLRYHQQTPLQSMEITVEREFGG